MRSNPSTAIVCLPLLDGAACDALTAHLGGAGWRDAQLLVPAYGAAVERSIRSGSVATPGPHAAIDRVLGWLDELNRQLYRFDLGGVNPADPLLAMRYRPGDHFDWHIDNGVDAVATRKLSFTVQLTTPESYDGGDLDLALYAPPVVDAAAHAGYRDQIRARGAITVFPSFHLHRVSPVTRGERLALVGWLHGPRFT